MSRVSFDRAVEYYDDTRGFAPGVAEAIRDAIVDYTQARVTSSRFLELGIGTGRIALPFIEAGYDYTGVDISLDMMNLLNQKLAKIEAGDGASASRHFKYQLQQADITQALSFAPNSFDVVITVHVLHLVEDWQTVLAQAKQVLKKPDGWLIIAYDSPRNRNNHEKSQAQSPQTLEMDLDPMRVVNAKWDEIIRELGIEPRSLRPGIWLADETLETYLRKELHATTVQKVALLEYERPPISLAQMAARHQARMYSGDWNLPDEAHAKASRKLQNWLDSEYGEQANQLIVTKGDFNAVTAKWNA